MMEDVLSIFTKYKSLMKYEPVKPDEKFLYKKQYFGDQEQEEDAGDFDEEEEEEEPENENDRDEL